MPVFDGVVSRLPRDLNWSAAEALLKLQEQEEISILSILLCMTYKYAIMEKTAIDLGRMLVDCRQSVF